MLLMRQKIVLQFKIALGTTPLKSEITESLACQAQNGIMELE